MPQLFLIRHAPTWQDPNLASKNWQLSPEAETSITPLAAYLEAKDIDSVVTSEELKAMETGRILAKQLNKPVSFFSGLEEHNRTGVTYLEYQEWNATLERFFKMPNVLVLGQETATEAKERFAKALYTLLKIYADQKLAVVSHATVMALFVASHNGLDSWKFWQTLKMPDLLVLNLPEFKLEARL
ncbi:MAG: histidine phosphatase family protein [Trueperaceae bacterium]|nr:histidine phosphatase family protein [Trueperaceae bacterium]